MASPRPDPDSPPADAGAGAGTVVRRAPFSDNPRVGARGLRTQQRIVDAALRVFAEDGYHQCGVARITELAGCSRAAFYQYFAGKEDVFRHLAGQVARQLAASVEALGLVTPDDEGWQATRAWIARYAATFERYRAVFLVFQTAVESDAAVAAGSARTSERLAVALRSRLAATTLPPRQLGPVVSLLLDLLPRVLDDASTLRAAAPGAYPEDRIEDALADVVHRTLFGLHAANVHAPPARRPPRLEFGPAMRDALAQDDPGGSLTPTGRRSLEALLAAGRDQLVARGYHATRIDDIVAAAGLSHGAFYRYFASKDDLVWALAVRAVRTVAASLADIPPAVARDGAARTADLRRWLRRYNATHAGEAAMIRVWADALLHTTGRATDSAAALDWGRRRLAHVLRPRGFGDVDTEAVVMVALLATFGARERPASTTDAAAHIIERGLLGR